jgi:hypothetical protein
MGLCAFLALIPASRLAFAAEILGSRRVELAWEEATGPVWGYRVQVARDGAPFESGEFLLSISPSFVLDGKEGSSYVVRVVAFDGEGNYGPPSPPSETLFFRAEPSAVPSQAADDFDGDGHSDVLLHDPVTGGVDLLVSTADLHWSLGSLAEDGEPTSWTIDALGDFDGDGITDVFWRQESSGATRFWLGTGAVDGPSISDPRWAVVAVGDFDGNGRDGLVWRNAARSAVGIWFMNGAAVTYRPLAAVDASWEVAAAGDFDGDGRHDLFWLREQTGEDGIWFMRGSQPPTSIRTSLHPGAGWRVAVAGDFDGDGRHDLVWRETASGANRLAFMDEVTARWAELPNRLAPGAVVAATADYNADGRLDLLWRPADGSPAEVWFLDGARRLGSLFLDVVADPTHLVTAVRPAGEAR